ncbi:cytochrome P450 [Streptomyces phaeochromogenes]|uniref:cytochrome P450 n=1 Tax=Streptomyces phaeochromogenes TaxID=1923 RepID=UPI0033C6A80F
MSDTAPSRTTPEAPSGSEEYPAFPMRRAPGCPFDQPPGLRALQAEQPLAKVRLWNGRTAWLATRHAYHQALLGDPRLSADASLPGWPPASPGTAERVRRAPTILTMNDREHNRIRGMVDPSLTPERVAEIGPAVQEIVDGLIDDMLAGPKPADLVEAFAEPAAARAICRLLGVPPEGYGFLQRNTNLIVRHGSSPQDVGAANDAIIDYLYRLLDEKRAHPSDELLSTLAVEQVATGRLTRRDAAVTCALLLLAGHETTGNMIALGSLLLLQHPDQLAELRESHDPELITGAVEELLRYLNVPQMGRRRVALEDIELDGHTICAGDSVVVSGDMANRDPLVFPDPDRLDIHRDASRHVAFSWGVHQCPGRALVRLTLRTAYRTLYRRIPTLTLAAPVEELRFKEDNMVYGVYELPVTW